MSRGTGINKAGHKYNPGKQHLAVTGDSSCLTEHQAFPPASRAPTQESPNCFYQALPSVATMLVVPLLGINCSRCPKRLLHPPPLSTSPHSLLLFPHALSWHCSRFWTFTHLSKSMSNTTFSKQPFLISASVSGLTPQLVEARQILCLHDPYLGITNGRPQVGIQLVNYVLLIHFMFYF